VSLQADFRDQAQNLTTLDEFLLSQKLLTHPNGNLALEEDLGLCLVWQDKTSLLDVTTNVSVVGDTAKGTFGYHTKVLEERFVLDLISEGLNVLLSEKDHIYLAKHGHLQLVQHDIAQGIN
jgi:hypothetical protein